MPARYAVIVTLTLLVACTVTRPPADPYLFAFLDEGDVSRSAVIDRFGPPAATLEEGRIITYRVAGNAESGYWIREPAPTWFGTNWSLVLVFDSHDRVRRHALVLIR